MLEALAETIETLTVAVDGDAISEASALRDRLDAKITDAVVAFDDAKLWQLEQARSLTAWLRARCSMTNREAGRTVIRVRRLRDLPVTAAAWRDGVVSSGQVDAIAANLDDETTELFADHEPDLVPRFAALSVADTSAAMQRWRSLAEGLTKRTPPRGERRTTVHLSRLLDGCRQLDAHLDPVGGEIVATALRMATRPGVGGEPERTVGERRGDALLDICQYFLTNQTSRRGGRHRPHLNIVVRLDDFTSHRGGRFVDGATIDDISLQTLACDSAMHRVLVSGRSSILDYGTAVRLVPPTLWNALVIRDEHCRFPDCDAPAEWCDAHHVIPVSEGGATSIDSTFLGCRRHHTILHQPGWHAKLLPDGTVEVTDPGGNVRVSRPPGTGPGP